CTPRNNRYLLVATDYLSKWVEVSAVSSADAKTVSQFLLHEIIARHGCPQEILSDQGTHFLNEAVTELLKNFQIRHRLSSPYHPQTNGLTERYNKTLCNALAKMSNKNKDDWDLHLPLA